MVLRTHRDVHSLTSDTRSLSSVQRTHRTGSLLRKHRLSVLTLLAGLTACGGGSEQAPLEEDSLKSDSPRMRALALESEAQTVAPALVELGPISGANIVIKSAITGAHLTGILRTRPDGTLDYDARSILSQTPGELYFVAEVWGGQDTDANDDGIPDAVTTPVNGSFQQIVPRTALTMNKPLIINPRAGMITEMIFNRSIPFSRQVLDHLTRESGAHDANGDGLVTYDDVNYVQMKHATGVSAVIPSISGWISSIHSGDISAKTKSLREVAKSENHIFRDIVPDPSNTLSHDPALRLRTMKSGTTILYTLDGSTPIAGQAGTLSATSEVVIPLQSKKLYYRESYSLGGVAVLGKVESFDLLTDWIEQSQSGRAYDTTTAEVVVPENFSYKGVSYSFETKAYTLSPGYPYPKTIDCTIHTTPIKAGCQYGPYEAYTADHEARIRTIVDMEVKKYIDSINIIVVPEYPQEIIRNTISYRNTYYTIYNYWTIDTVTKKRRYPVSLLGRYLMLNGSWDQVYLPDAQNEAERTSRNIEMETLVKKKIDLNQGVGGPVTHIQNDLLSLTGKIEYFGGWYELWNNWNPAGDSDFPVTIIGNLSTLTGGRQGDLIDIASSESERVSKGNAMTAQMQAVLQASYNAAPKPTYAKNQRIETTWTSYRGYQYRTITLMNTTGYSDYPASVFTEYTLADGIRTTMAMPVRNVGELASVQSERASNARALMDVALGVDIFSPNQVILWNDRTYGTGAFRTTVTYSGTVGLDYPAYIDVNYRVSTGATGKITLQVSNASERNLLALQAENEAKRIIDNTPLSPANEIKSEGPLSYGTQGGTYSVYAKYNRVGTNNNYPALLWIEYRKTPTSPLQTTQITYGTMTANNSDEKPIVRKVLEDFVKGQIVASIDSPRETRMAMSKRIQDILPLGSAHAALSTTSTLWTPQQYAQKVTPLAPYLGTAPFPAFINQKYIAKESVMQTFLTARRATNPNVTSTSIEDTGAVLVIRDIQASAEKIKKYRLECSGAGTTFTGRMEIDCNRHYENIRTEENKIYTAIGNYLLFGKGLSLGAGQAIYEEIMGIGSDVVALTDGTLIQEFQKNLQFLKTKIAPYIVNEEFNFGKAGIDFIKGASAIEEELRSLLGEIPAALNSLDAQSKGYYMGVIGGGFVLEMVNPIKKPKLLAKGFTYGTWLYKARYLIDSNKVGHTLVQKIEIMKKLDRVRWSRVEKPDMTRIQSQDFKNIIEEVYRSEGTIGNKSTADILRYEKATGILKSSSGHAQKAEERRTNLLGVYSLLNTEEKKIADAIYNDLSDAINYKP